jgi:hypothetical protein
VFGDETGSPQPLHGRVAQEDASEGRQVETEIGRPSVWLAGSTLWAALKTMATAAPIGPNHFQVEDAVYLVPARRQATIDILDAKVERIDNRRLPVTGIGEQVPNGVIQPLVGSPDISREVDIERKAPKLEQGVRICGPKLPHEDRGLLDPVGVRLD